MRGMDIFQKPYYREISTMRGCPMRGLPVVSADSNRTDTVSKLLILAQNRTSNLPPTKTK